MSRTHCNRMQRQKLAKFHAWPILLLGLLLAFNAMAEPAGRLLFARGEVQVLREGEPPRMVVRGDEIEVGDTLRTSEGASAQLRLSDGAMVALHSDTLFKIDAQRYNEKAPDEGSQAAQLLRGGLRAITGAIARERPEAVKLSTPVATIGIRGTVYETIYIPPEGLPGLPGVPPGHYTLVLEGRVALANPAGELTLGVGEIGYVADADTQPELRPDLSWLFALYASPEEDDGGAGDDGSGEPDTGEIDRVLTEMAPGQPVVTTGPLAFVIGTDVGGSPVYTGEFIYSPVQVAAGGELTYADGGVGDISLVDATGGAIGLLSSGSSTAGDSTINWGAYDSAYFSLEPNTLTVTTLHFINATQVLATIRDLPTTGSFTYDYVGDSGVAGAILDSASNLQVDFGNGTMSVELISGTDTWSGTNEAIASFYGAGLALSNPGLGTTGTINGRFVGSNAEGAMTSFSLDVTDGYITGTAAFAR